jgi:hypothetical protein
MRVIYPTHFRSRSSVSRAVGNGRRIGWRKHTHSSLDSRNRIACTRWSALEAE